MYEKNQWRAFNEGKRKTTRKKNFVHLHWLAQSQRPRLSSSESERDIPSRYLFVFKCSINMSTYALQHFISGGKIASHLSLNVVEIGIYRDFCFTFDKKKREQNRFIRFRFFLFYQSHSFGLLSNNRQLWHKLMIKCIFLCKAPKKDDRIICNAVNLCEFNLM